MPHAHALDVHVAAQQRDGGGVVQHRNADLFQPFVQRRDEMLATAQDVACKTAPELELPRHLERLPPERRLEPYALFPKPNSCIEAVADQYFG